MSVLTLARVQFAMTTIFHFLFVPLSIGLGLAVAIMETLYVVKKDEMYKDMAKFWGRIFILSFAVGVVTGIIQEFQFGMNWSEYSRFVGDIFGAPLAVEALLAFFMESTFIGLWAFGWDKFSKKLHLLFIWLVSFGSIISALWILMANAFMQNPVAYQFNPETGRAELTSFIELLKNHQLWLEFPHVVFGAFVTGGFVIAGLSAFKLLKKKDTAFFTRSLKFGLIMGMISALLTMGMGHFQTQAIIEDHPMKFAAMEGIYEDTDDPAPWKLVGLMDNKNRKEGPAIEIPYMLSILGSSHEGSFKGMNRINEELKEEYGHQFGSQIEDYYVPVNTLFWSFRVMVGFGGLLFVLAALVLFLMKKDKLKEMRWLLGIVGLSTFVPFIANTAGWLITELGRYPWTVYGMFTIADSVSPTVTWTQVLFTNIVFFLLFSFLAGVLVFLVRRAMQEGPYFEEQEAEKMEKEAKIDPLSKEAF